MSRKIINFSSDILNDMTLEKEGYLPSKYGSKSAKFIWAVCRYCGEPARIRKQFYTQAENSACHNACRLQEMKQQVSPFDNVQTRQKAKDTMLSRYGVASAMLSSSIVEKATKKRRQTFIEKIGKSPRLTRDLLSFLPDDFPHIIGKSDDPFDILFPNKKLAIRFVISELMSEYVLNPKISRSLQLKAMRSCNEQNIRCFTIFDLKWEDRKKQYTNFIRTILGLNTENVMARKCLVTNSECKEFFNENHIQGYGTGTLQYFNLENNGKILASMTASKHHRQCDDSAVIVLNRLCFKDGFNIAGGASKLFKVFIEWAKDNRYKKIVSWSDNCWTDGNIYKVLNFTLEQEFGPDYFYWSKEDNTYKGKQSQQKDATDCPSHLTEREWCLQRGLYRIWDCGKKRWEFAL